MTRVAIGFLVAILAACSQSIYVSDRANAMLGKTEAELVAEWGPNYTVGVNEDAGAINGKTLTYQHMSFQELMAQGTWAQLLTRSRCSVIFTLDAGRVKYATLRGNGCA